MRTVLTLPILVLSTVLLSGCIGSQRTTTPDSSTKAIPAAEEKSGDTVKTGTILETEGTFFIQQTGKLPEAIESYGVNLQQYVGQTVTVTGQYSGNTLFVGKVQTQ